jgi:hypothetical protein
MDIECRSPSVLREDAAVTESYVPHHPGPRYTDTVKGTIVAEEGVTRDEEQDTGLTRTSSR